MEIKDWYAYARAIIYSRGIKTDAEDLVQEIVIKWWDQDCEDKNKAYLSAVARSVVTEYCRRNYGRRTKGQVKKICRARTVTREG